MSSGLSSTSRISTGLSATRCLSRKGEIKRCTLLQGRRRPKFGRRAGDNSLHDGESYARSLVVFDAVQSLKDIEQFIDILHVEADAVVADEVDCFALFALAADFDSSLESDSE